MKFLCIPVYRRNDFKTRQRAFTPCPKLGNKIEGVVLHRVFITGFFRPKQGQVLKLSAAHLYLNIGQVSPTPWVI